MFEPQVKRARRAESTHSPETKYQKVAVSSACTTTSNASAVPRGKPLNALKCLRLHPCVCTDDIDKPVVTYTPLFAHHFFEKELIYGWTNCNIDIFYTPDRFNMYVQITGQAGEDADELTETKRVIDNLMSIKYTQRYDKKESFIKASFEKGAKFLPHGELVTSEPISYSPDRCPTGMNVSEWETKSHLELYVTKFDPENTAFNEYHRNVEYFMHFFIESCSSIDHDDRWLITLAYVVTDFTKKKMGNSPAKNKNTQHTVYELAGIATVYKFFALPRCRNRISQFVVFPHMQQKGLGLRMMKQIYKMTIEDEEIMELTVEDPAASFVQLRDVTCIALCMDLNVVSLPQLYSGGDKVELPTREELKLKLKESPMQITRVLNCIHLCQLLPDPLPTPPNVIRSGDGDGSSFVYREWRDNDVKEDMAIVKSEPTDTPDFGASDNLREFRIQVKRQIYKNNADVYCGLTQSEIQGDLEKEWQYIYASYFRTIQKVRSLYPLSATNK